MLDIDFIQGRPALEVEFRVSLAQDLVNALSLVMEAPWIEGLDQWVYATHAALPPTLKSDMETVLILMHKCCTLSSWLHQLPADHPSHREFGAFVTWLQGMTDDDYRELVASTLANLSAQEGEAREDASPTLTIKDTQGLRARLGTKLEGDQLDQAIHLIRNPAELKTQFISIVTRFWEQFYAQEFQRCLPLMERSAAYHSHQEYQTDFDTIFTAVTGRLPLQDRGGYEDLERLILIPSCHIGPYVILHDDEELRPVATLHYNCRPTAAPEREQTSPIQDLFPPLKALSDETRLQILSILNGRELYAQEIVDRLDISQSAVSRHLKLMQSGGLLNVRPIKGLKYFSINEETLAAVSNRLRDFRGKSGG